VVEEGRHDTLMQARGLYYQLMREQSLDRGPGQGQAKTARAAAARPDTVQPRPLNADAAQVGWRDTLSTLLAFVRPWRGTLISTVLLGVARVAAFIGVGVLSALVVAAVRDGQATGALVVYLNP
jgi:ATP-binding cassette subfamily C protein CydCD